MKVWILILYLSGYNQGGPTVIDNIISKEECARVQKVFEDSTWSLSSKSRCVEVLKAPVVPQKESSK